MVFLKLPVPLAILMEKFAIAARTRACLHEATAFVNQGITAAQQAAVVKMLLLRKSRQAQVAVVLIFGTRETQYLTEMVIASKPPRAKDISTTVIVTQTAKA